MLTNFSNNSEQHQKSARARKGLEVQYHASSYSCFRQAYTLAFPYHLNSNQEHLICHLHLKHICLQHTSVSKHMKLIPSRQNNQKVQSSKHIKPPLAGTESTAPDYNQRCYKAGSKDTTSPAQTIALYTTYCYQQSSAPTEPLIHSPQH